MTGFKNKDIGLYFQMKSKLLQLMKTMRDLFDGLARDHLLEKNQNQKEMLQGLLNNLK